MVDATLSCARLRRLANLGFAEAGRLGAGGAAPTGLRASRQHPVADAASIADGLPPRPRAASRLPGTGDLMASTI